MIYIFQLYLMAICISHCLTCNSGHVYNNSNHVLWIEQNQISQHTIDPVFGKSIGFLSQLLHILTQYIISFLPEDWMIHSCFTFIGYNFLCLSRTNENMYMRTVKSLSLVRYCTWRLTDVIDTVEVGLCYVIVSTAITLLWLNWKL